jgi:hypothetical protein
VIGAAVSKEFAEREKPRPRKRPSHRGGAWTVFHLLVPSQRDQSPRCGGLNAHKALKAHTSPRCGGLNAHKALKAHTSPRCGGLNAHKALKEHTSPRCGGLMRIVRLKSTLPPALAPWLRGSAKFPLASTNSS